MFRLFTDLRLRLMLVGGIAALAGGVPAVADNFVVNDASITFDRWNYPFNGTPGIRGAAPTFGALANESFDERDGQFLIGIDTASLGVPAGLNPSDYQITSLTVEATHSTGTFAYDPTYDGYQSFLDPADPDFEADADAGRPIVLTGAALRNGFSEFTFDAVGDSTRFAQNSSFGGAPLAGTRNAFAAALDDDGNLIDIGNNIGTNAANDQGFDFTPWAVGSTDLDPGQTVVEAVPGVSAGSTFTFDLTPMLSDPDVLNYIQQGLADGGLFFSITSLHETGMSGGSNPNFYTRDNFDPAAIAPQASFDVTVVPEPASLALLAFGGGVALARRRRNRS